MASALVTGGAGFIGSHLVDALIQRGDEVTVYDNLSTGREANLATALEQGAKAILAPEADVRDAAALAETAREASADLVFHLAAQMDVRRSIADPGLDAAVNVVGTVNALEAARACGARFVLTSTAGVYGEGEGRELPLGESASADALSPYGASKRAAELYVELWHRLHGISAATIRLANAYGPRQDPGGEAGVVAIFCDSLRGGAPVRIFGDGGQTRDYVYVGDIVEGLLAAADAGFSGTVNVSSGVETSVLELLERVASTLGVELGPGGVEPSFEVERPGEIRRSALDPSLAARELGWSPRTTLAEGLAKTAPAAAV